MKRRFGSKTATKSIVPPKSSRKFRLIDSTDSGSSFDELLRQARNGEGRALGEMLQSYRRYLIFLARSGLHRQMQGKVEPADLVQEVSLAATNSFIDFRGDSAEEFAGWLRGILANILAMHVRKYLGTQKRDPHLEQDFNRGLNSASSFLHSGLAGDITSPSQHFARNEAFLRMAEAIETLPEHYRQVIVLRHVENMSFAEVALQMERSVDSVEKLWVRALAKLKQSMGDE